MACIASFDIFTAVYLRILTPIDMVVISQKIEQVLQPYFLNVFEILISEFS
jgi:hypothetical protein